MIEDASIINLYGSKAQNGAISVITKKGKTKAAKPTALQDTLEANDPLYIVDGEKQHSIEGINAETIKSVTVIKGDGATNLYGDEGKQGVILVTTKDAGRNPAAQEVSGPDNNLSAKIPADSPQITANLENDKVAMGIKNNQATTLEVAGENVLIFVDGKKRNKNELSQLDPDNVDAMTVFKGKSAIERYGEEGKDGVIEITTKGKN